MRLIGLLTLVLLTTPHCKTTSSEVLSRDQESAISSSEFASDPYGINQTPNYKIDFQKLAAAEWEGDNSSGVDGEFIRDLNSITDAEYQQMEAHFCGGTPGCKDFDRSLVLFHAITKG